jgi:hypothetical protein
MEVEDGEGLADADSYVSLADAAEYCTSHGLTFAISPAAPAEAALIRATAFIDNRYSSSFPGYRKAGRSQALQWPRAVAYDSEGWLIADDEIPIEVIEATIEAAVREFAVPNSMMPDLERGGEIQSLRAGSVSITYASGAPAETKFSIIDRIMSNILNGTQGSGGGLFGRAMRG